MVILKATMKDIKDLIRWHPTHDPRAGTRRCLLHTNIDIRSRPVESCTQCALDLRDFAIDVLKASIQINRYFLRLREVLTTAQDAGTS